MFRPVCDRCLDSTTLFRRRSCRLAGTCLSARVKPSRVIHPSPSATVRHPSLLVLPCQTLALLFALYSLWWVCHRNLTLGATFATSLVVLALRLSMMDGVVI